MTAQLPQKELHSLGSYIQAAAENIRALARIAEIHQPFPSVLLRLARTDSSPAVAITIEETRLLLSVVRDSGHHLRLRDEALFSIYAMTGIRRAEAVGLDASDYDAEAGTLRIRDAKSGRVRNVPVIEPLGGLPVRVPA